MANANEISTRYISLLKHELGQATHCWLEDVTRTRKLYFGDRPVCTVLSPLFIDAEVYRRSMEATQLVAKAAYAHISRLAGSEALRRRCQLPLSWEPYLRLDSSPPASALFSRFDGFLDEQGTIRFLEFNGQPFGMSFTHALSEAFLESPAMTRLVGEGFRPRWESTVAAAARAILGRYGNNTGKPPCIGVLFNEREDSVTFAETMKMLTMAEAVGLRVKVSSNIDVTDSGVYFDGERVDVVHLLDTSLLGDDPSKHPLMRVVGRTIPLFGGAAAPLFIGHKALIALLSEDVYAADSAVSTAVRAAVAKHIPWTRLVNEGKARDRNGRDIDLIPHVRNHRTELVLKPSAGFGGKGVVLGHEATESEWEAALAAATQSPYVVQERVETRVADFAVWGPGGLEIEARRIDFNPYVWDGSIAQGVWIRTSRAGLMNLTAGAGSMTTCFVVD